MAPEGDVEAVCCDAPWIPIYYLRLKVAIEEKRPEWVNRHSKLIFQHDNARPHTAKVVKTYLNGQDWEVLPHSLYSPDIAPSDYYLFRTMQSDLTGELRDLLLTKASKFALIIGLSQKTRTSSCKESVNCLKDGRRL